MSTRVKSPDSYEYKKLCRVVQNLYATKALPLTIEADWTHVVKWFDASYAVHP